MRWRASDLRPPPPPPTHTIKKLCFRKFGLWPNVIAELIEKYAEYTYYVYELSAPLKLAVGDVAPGTIILNSAGMRVRALKGGIQVCTPLRGIELTYESFVFSLSLKFWQPWRWTKRGWECVLDFPMKERHVLKLTHLVERWVDRWQTLT
jgi:hypothetical protein